MKDNFFNEVAQIFADLHQAELEAIRQTKRAIDGKIFAMNGRRRRTHEEVEAARELKRKKKTLRQEYHESRKRRK